MGKRLKGTGGERHVRAKTGTLAASTALSGYVGATGRSPVAFSVLVSAIPQRGAAKREARRVQDEVAEAIVAFLEASPETP